MNPVVDDKPRMSAADADARFAALVAEHRAGKKSRAIGAVTRRSNDAGGAVSGRSHDRTGPLAFVAMFCLGVAAGAIFHVKPLLAILLGVPTIYIARYLYLRSRDRADAR